MKKYLYIALAAAALSSCSSDDTLDVVKGEEIAFGNAFVDNSTRAAEEYTAASEIESFKVYGTVTGEGNTATLYNGATVTKNGTAWNCTQKEYWIPSCSYSFTAVVEGEISNNQIAYNMGDGDLLLSKATASTNAQGTPSQNPVEFTFGHLLSKTFFTFTNGTEVKDKYKFQITGISITGYASSGTFDVTKEVWSETLGTASTTALTYTASDVVGETAVTSTANLLVPGKQSLSITIAYDVLYVDGDDNKKLYSTSTTKSLTDYTFVKNHVYNFAVTLPAPGNEITFTVKNELSWGDTTEVPVQ